MVQPQNGWACREIDIDAFFGGEKKRVIISGVQKDRWASFFEGVLVASRSKFQGEGYNGFPMGAATPGPDADQFLPDSNQPNNVALRRCPSNRFVTCLWQQKKQRRVCG